MTLTHDQRWLLRTVGPSISRALISDAGLQHFMSSARGYFGSACEGAPEWMDSYETTKGRIVSPARLGVTPKAVVTAADIRRFRSTIQPALLAELAAIDKAETDEHWRTELWCYCPGTGPHKDFLGRDQYHPTTEEHEAHMAATDGLWDREFACLNAILAVSEPLGQLDLFEVVA